MNTQKPIKPMPLLTQGRVSKTSATPNTSAASSVSKRSTSTGKRNRHAPHYYGFEISVCSVSNSEPALVSKKPKSNPVKETVILEDATQPPIAETNFELPVVIPPYSGIRPLSSSQPDYDYADWEREVNMSVFDAENQIWN